MMSKAQPQAFLTTSDISDSYKIEQIPEELRDGFRA